MQRFVVSKLFSMNFVYEVFSETEQCRTTLVEHAMLEADNIE